jgi:hypothetical protein
MKTNILSNRGEKIKFLNNLKKRISIVDDIIYPECEIWEKDNTGYNAVSFAETIIKKPVRITNNEMENKIKAKNKTVIKTHNEKTVIIF